MNKSKLQTILLLLLLLFIISCSKQDPGMIPLDLKCEYLEDPINIDLTSPRLSWKILPVDKAKGEHIQTAFEILVSSSKDKLANDIGDLWSTGKVKTSQSTFVKYEGKTLESRQDCFWKVRMWDQTGAVSNWSETGYWKMALLHASDWDGSGWIGIEGDSRDSYEKYRIKQKSNQREAHRVESFPAPLLRKEFMVTSEVKEAFLYISGLGYNEVFINGIKSGDRKLEPGQTTYDNHVLYTSYNIKDLIKKDKNVIGVYLGNGFYGQNMAFSSSLAYGKPRLIAKIWIGYSNGKMQIISSDTSWKASTGPIVFDNVYAGETYDARKEIPGWSTPAFDATGWENAVALESPGGFMKSQLIPPMRKIRELQPVNIIQNDQDTWTIDFGQNISGWARIKVNEVRSKKIHLSYAEALYLDSSRINKTSLGAAATGFNQDDIYICNGAGEETWESRFTYHGFQFVEISGLSTPPNEETVTAVLVHTDVQPIADFSCSNPLLNKMYEISKWTVVDNLHSIPEDCPHREKCGWLGDAHATAEFSIYNYDMARFYTKYMNDIHSVLGRSKMDSMGNPIGPKIPTFVAPGKRLGAEATLDWGVAIIYLPWYLYLYYGDIEVFEIYYNDMKVFIDHMFSFGNTRGIIENGLGDWCPPWWDRAKNPEAMQCHPFISANAFFYKALDIMSFMANQFGDTEYGKWAEEKAEKLKEAFNEEYLVPINEHKWYGSQTATVMALEFDMVPEDIKNEVIEGLSYDIITVNNLHHTVGIHGHRPYYSLLTNLGKEDLAYSVLTNPTFPSQAYIVNAGLTTWPERIWEWEKVEWERSLNHPMQAGFAAFFHENILGIKPDKQEPGFKHIIMKPHFIHQLEWAKGYHRSLYGDIKSHWMNKENEFEWTIEIPPACSATVFLPVMGENQITVNDNPPSRKELKILSKNEDYTEVQVGAGEYQFRVW